MHSRWRALVSVLLLVALSGFVSASHAAAQPEETPPREVSVAVHTLTPFVIKNEDRWTGFTIELWDEIADRLGWTTNYVEVPDIPAQLQSVADGEVDVAAGGISITAERERQFDFSQPIIDAGLQIAVPTSHAGPSSPGLMQFLQLLFSSMMLVWLGAALVITILPAHILWFIERRHSDSTVSRSYFPGIFQAFGWGLGALAAQADSSPRHWVGRSMAILWAFVSIIFVAFYTANLTATLTVEKLEAQINGPADLYEKSVATVANTTSAAYLNSVGIPATQMASIEDCYRALRDENYDAVVFDAPVLRFYVAHQGKGIADVAGPVFQEENYGVVFQIGSELRKPVDQTLLRIREDGTYDLLEDKWFGDDGSSSASGSE